LRGWWGRGRREEKEGEVFFEDFFFFLRSRGTREPAAAAAAFCFCFSPKKLVIVAATLTSITTLAFPAERRNRLTAISGASSVPTSTCFERQRENVCK
jgi:hypothetical protein